MLFINMAEYSLLDGKRRFVEPPYITERMKMAKKTFQLDRPPACAFYLWYLFSISCTSGVHAQSGQ